MDVPRLRLVVRSFVLLLLFVRARESAREGRRVLLSFVVRGLGGVGERSP